MAKLSVQILSLLFGLGSWIAITGLWLEMPVLINRLPEGWTLASDMNLMIQSANIGLIVYYLCKKLKLIDESKASHLLLFIAFCSCILLITSWSQTVVVFGSDRSVPLFVATFGLALLDCTSSVTFLPFMARFDTSYLTPYLIGEGLSGFIPSIFALIQGVDQTEECPQNKTIDPNLWTNSSISDDNRTVRVETRFSAEIFFTSLLFTLAISWLSLILLQKLPVCKEETRILIRNKSDDIELTQKLADNLSAQIVPQKSHTNNKNNNYKICDKTYITKRKYIYYLLLIFWSCLLTFGFMPSIQPYSALPYGNDTLHYVVLLTGISFPFGCFLALIFIRRSIQLINYLTLIANLIAIYISICALMSPYPPFLTSSPSIGATLMIMSWISYTTILSYTKTVITLIISDYNGDKGLFWVGFHTQLGAFLGALLMFVAINYTNVFNETHCNY